MFFKVSNFICCCIIFSYLRNTIQILSDEGTQSFIFHPGFSIAYPRQRRRQTRVSRGLAQHNISASIQTPHYRTKQGIPSRPASTALKAMGINAVIFQVRAQSDAFYASKLEPWSRYLTDGGKAPLLSGIPLEFIIDEAHRRGMELHAWINPYRVTTTAKQTVPKGHIALKHPDRFIRYDGKLYFDPGRPENREFIGRIVDDIVASLRHRRYTLRRLFLSLSGQGQDICRRCLFPENMARDVARRLAPQECRPAYRRPAPSHFRG